MDDVIGGCPPVYDWSLRLTVGEEITCRFEASGRVALAVARQGSHRSGRARIRASGSSTNSFTIHVVPEAIQSSDVDMLIEPRCVRHVSLD